LISELCSVENAIVTHRQEV